MNVVYEDAFYTQFNDGTEEVRFSEAEWAVMLTDPAFGYVCTNGHRFAPQIAQLRAEGRDVPCPECSRLYEDQYSVVQYEAEENRLEFESLLAAEFGGTPVPEFTGERSEQPFLI